MPSRKLLLAMAALLLLAAAVAAGETRYEVGCSRVGGREIDTTSIVRVSFAFSAVSPVFPGLPFASRGNLIYSPVYTVTWDRPLVFTVHLDHYAPHQKWVIGRYICTLYVNGTAKGSGVYDVVDETPKWMRTTVSFVVPPTATTYSESTEVEVSLPLKGGYCAAPPDPDTWPGCPNFRAWPNVVTTLYNDWEALMVNGYRPGDVVAAYGVEAEVPDPWKYGIESNVGTFSYVVIDDNIYPPKVEEVRVNSSVSLYMVGMPKTWGSVTVTGAQVPLYVAKTIALYPHPTEYCRPPSCIILANHRLEQGGWCDTPTYMANVAVQSGVTMTEDAWLDLRVYSGSEIHLPLGSIMEATARAQWSTGTDIPIYWGTVYPRVVNSSTYYEDLGRKKKLLTRPGYGVLGVAFAVDQSQPSIEIGLYSRPIPYYPGTMYTTAQGYAITSRCVYRIGPIQYEEIMPRFLYTPLWLTLGLYSHHRDLTGNRYPDLLRFLYREPTTYRPGGGVTTETGMVTVRTQRYYDDTTADPGGSHQLYYVSGILPTDAAVLYIISARQSLGGGTDEVAPWLVFLVPTAACRSTFCTSLSPELLGPLPPFFGDRSLPNAGYSIMLMYIGKTGRHRVAVYVEDGYIISSGPPINVTRARNYKLVEIEKEWKPFEAVIVGPGWWVPFRRLGTCETMPLNVPSIYATPDRAGVYKIIVEVNGRSSTYDNHVTDIVAYRITTRTPAPESITATPFNMTAYVTLDGVPYFHMVYGYGEGGRLSPPACLSTWYNNTFPASQLYVSGDFWGTLGLTMLPKPVNIQYVYSKPRLELVEPWRGLVKVKADGPVSGFAFYAQRNGTWVKIGEAAGSCLLVNASRLFPWDPILVLPLVEQVLDAAPGSTVMIWRPETALLFKTWADLVGYPKGARSVLDVVRRC
jgi:hypothetical protein